MLKDGEKIIYETESLCPVCLKKIPASRVKRGEDVYFIKNCPEHGKFDTILWRGKPYYEDWVRETEKVLPKKTITESVRGCPFDCGVCSAHEQQACCVLLEVTQRCNQHCFYCFANAEDERAQDPSMEEIRQWYQMLLDIGEDRPFNIQLSGGEPTVRDDLSEIIRLGKSMGFPYIQLNTNGKRLAEDVHYVEELKNAGLSAVFLQFDGTTDGIYERLRGQKLLKQKEKAIENCEKNQLGVVLVPTLVPGVNTDNIGEIIRFAVERLPAVRGVHFQPVSYFGRYPDAPGDSQRITLPEVMAEIEKQTGGEIPIGAFQPQMTGNPLCSFHGSFVYMEDRGIVSIGGTAGSCKCQGNNEDAIIKARDFVAKKWTRAEKTACCGTGISDSLSDFDRYIERVRDYGFSISGMAFQDIWNLDLERLRRCKIHVMNVDKRVVPFCAFNLTDQQGNPLYRGR